MDRCGDAVLHGEIPEAGVAAVVVAAEVVSAAVEAGEVPTLVGELLEPNWVNFPATSAFSCMEGCRSARSSTLPRDAPALWMPSLETAQWGM